MVCYYVYYVGVGGYYVGRGGAQCPLFCHVVEEGKAQTPAPPVLLCTNFQCILCMNMILLHCHGNSCLLMYTLSITETLHSCLASMG